ncbi:unnamed protein product [Brassica rapa]|uniref:Secreted protein n=1 Tax=Brassica campestris TaxID=3711 RepID=A0A3P6AZG5_BRACM|nr:unnamed protein product [Brassica rapa]VDC92344.1 unnamed protein product [Brassica rapa]
MKKLVTFILSTLFLTTANSETQCRSSLILTIFLTSRSVYTETHSSTIPRAVSETVASSSTSLVLVPTLPIVACHVDTDPILKTLM